MGCPSDHESSYLTPGEWSVLRAAERELRATDARLDVALDDGVPPVPLWLLWMGRAALIVIPLVLLLPFAWWGGIVVVALTFRVLRRRG